MSVVNSDCYVKYFRYLGNYFDAFILFQIKSFNLKFYLHRHLFTYNFTSIYYLFPKKPRKRSDDIHKEREPVYFTKATLRSSNLFKTPIELYQLNHLIRHHGSKFKLQFQEALIIKEFDKEFNNRWLDIFAVNIAILFFITFFVWFKVFHSSSI